VRVRPGAWLAILVSAAAVAITWKLDVLNCSSRGARQSGVTVRDEQPVVVEPAARPAKRALKTDRDRRARVLRAVS
jgi:hypothetical protein